MELIFEYGLKLALVMALVLLNGFFVAAEFAIVKIRETQLHGLIARGHRGARIAQGVIRNLDASLSATQLGITLASLGLGWVGEPIFESMLQPLMDAFHIRSPEARHSISFAVGFTVITFLHIVLGELAPKSLAIQKPLPTTLWVARPLQWFYKISFPFIWLLNNTSLWILRRIGIEPVSESEMVHSQEELRLLFSSMHAHSGGSMLHRDIVLNALELQHRIVRDVMRPRKEIIALDTESTLAECLEVADKTQLSRFPLAVDGDLDRTVGVVHVKDLYAMRGAKGRAWELMRLTRRLIYVPETARLEKLLQLFLERKSHLAIVVDEYGTTVGMVTLENILEELVGQIQDEFDQEKPLLIQVKENEWELDGALPLHELSEAVGQDVSEEGITTTSGWITHRLGGFPKVGDQVTLDQCILTVEAMDGLRVSQVRLRKHPPADEADAGAGAE